MQRRNLGVPNCIELRRIEANNISSISPPRFGDPPATRPNKSMHHFGRAFFFSRFGDPGRVMFFFGVELCSSIVVCNGVQVWERRVCVAVVRWLLELYFRRLRLSLLFSIAHDCSPFTLVWKHAAGSDIKKEVVED